MNQMYLQMGMAALDGFGSFMQAKMAADMAEATRKYQNAMSALSAAQAQNTVTGNEINVRDASIREAEAIQIAALEQEGAAKVAAGAAGVGGGSTSAVMRDLKRSAASANYARTSNLKSQYRAFGQERKNIELAKIYNKDISVIPQPSAFSALLGVGANVLDIYEQYQPPGAKLFG